MSSSKANDDAQQAAAALRTYARKAARSEKEAEAFLSRRGFAEDVVREAIAVLKQEGALDDKACVLLWADHWSRQGWAWEAIASKLEAKGFRAEALEHAYQRLGSREQDEERAQFLLQQQSSKDKSRQEASRLARLLASHGHSQDVIERFLAPTRPFSP